MTPFVPAAQADSHALLMTIDYAGTEASLPARGIEADGRMAQEMARLMGVPESNIRWLRNGQLSLAGIAAAIDELAERRVRDGDKVFLYYSGHGTQYLSKGGAGTCSEAIVGADLGKYGDDRFEAALSALSARAAQVVVMNDSCFSGGQAARDRSGGVGADFVPKVYYPKSGLGSDATYVCNQPVNQPSMWRSLGMVRRERSARLVYLAASSSNEVSWATPNGSAATVAWTRCLRRRQTDRDGNTFIDANELRACAQQELAAAGGRPQTITLEGEGGLALGFTESVGSGNQAVASPSSALEGLRASADRTIQVSLEVRNRSLKIGRDLLDFSIRIDQPGYVYLLHVGTDGKLYQLFPNRRDDDNFLQAGTHRFPRPQWAIQAAGPAGTGYLMAYVSRQPRDFSGAMEKDGVFAMSPPTERGVRNLVTVGLDGRHGASALLAISELP